MQRLGIEGVLILAVVNGGAADDAGLLPTTEEDDGIHLGDVIVAIDGKKVRTGDDLLATLEDHEAGDVVKIRCPAARESSAATGMELSVTLKSLPSKIVSSRAACRAVCDGCSKRSRICTSTFPPKYQSPPDGTRRRRVG